MAEEFTPNFTGETYDDPISSGEFQNRGYIGKVRVVRRWDAGFAKEDFETNDGKKFLKGRIYLDGTKEAAVEFVKQYMNLEFVTPVLVVSTPLASVTNLTDETKDKFKSPVLVSAARLQGLGKGDYKQSKHGAGFNLVTAPSVVDAYARAKKWYTDPLFDVNLIGDIHATRDCDELMDKLAEARKAIWAALGGEDWRVNNPGDASGKLAEALGLFAKSLEQWGRMHIVFDPSPAAIYDTKKEEKPLDRNRVPAITQFFASEREAIAVGQAEAGGESKAELPWNELSEKTRSTYGDVNGLAGVLPDIIAALKTAPKPKVAADYGLTVGDLNLLVK